jgi:glycopeptide antibiotics resistance protein
MILILVSILPLNGTNSLLNNNYTISIRWDYLVHALLYIPLFPLLSFKKGKHGIIKIILFSIILAISMEAIQYIIPWRTFNVNDMFSNILGVVIGFVLIKVVSKLN